MGMIFSVDTDIINQPARIRPPPPCAQVTHCFQQTMFGVSGDKKAVDFINYNQFREFLGRLALLAYNFREKEQKPPTVSFSGDDYSEHAKHLWFGNPAQPNPHAGAHRPLCPKMYTKTLPALV